MSGGRRCVMSGRFFASLENDVGTKAVWLFWRTDFVRGPIRQLQGLPGLVIWPVWLNQMHPKPDRSAFLYL